MLRTALLFFLLLGFVSSEIQAATATATAATWHPIHRRKPTAGNYVPVYRYYRGHKRHKNRFRGLFKRHSTARHSSSHRSRAHRTL